jgi:nucleoside-diphosphate-sugar epimerase
MIKIPIAVTGAGGYLGSAVMQELRFRRCDHVAVPGRLHHLPPQSLDCRAVVHCAGRLRGHSDQQIWTDNVKATAALLHAIPPSAPVIFASSRAAVATTPDQYGHCKRQAESLVAARSGPVSIVRLTVLAGPSPRGLGSSFLYRMIKSAMRVGTITTPQQTRMVDLLDVREVAAALASLTEQPHEHNVMVHATSGSVGVFELAELIAQAVRAATGQHVTLVRGSIPESGHPDPESPEQWQELLAQNGISRIPVEATIRDTIAIEAAMLEPDHADL